MTNLEFAHKTLKHLTQLGVKQFCVCAGARNAPLVEILSVSNGLRVEEFFEERQAAFYALGAIKRTGAPVAVVTTSGTAVAELLPATIEADYQGLPLVLLTADRPSEYRGSAAPQSIKQIGIFSHYVSQSLDLSLSKNELSGLEIGSRPVHINLCFEEPLVDKAELASMGSLNFEPNPFNKQQASLENIEFESAKFSKPLVVVSNLNSEDAKFVESLSSRIPGEFYLEATSNLRGKVTERLCDIPSHQLKHSFLSGTYDSIIRVGGVPTVRLWRDLESELIDVPVVSFSTTSFSGLARQKQKAFPLQVLESVLTSEESSAKPDKDIEPIITKFKNSEPGFVRKLSRLIPEKADVFIGNSLPIREWDEFSDTAKDGSRTYFANRGVNGIDGLISTALGLADENELWVVIGDLSALYDLSSLWALRYVKSKVRIVVINNGGGMIFNRMFNNPMFENQHDLNFGKWAEMFGLSYLQIGPGDQWPEQLNDKCVIELNPDANETKAFNDEYLRWQ